MADPLPPALAARVWHWLQSRFRRFKLTITKDAILINGRVATSEQLKCHRSALLLAAAHMDKTAEELSARAHLLFQLADPSGDANARLAAMRAGREGDGDG